MTQRERKLAVAFGGVVGLLALWFFFSSLILDPIWKAQAEVTALQAEEAALQARVKMEALYRRQWNELRAKTLAGDPNVAAGQLDVLIKHLMQESGLINSPSNISRPREEKKTWPGLYIISYTVTQADGTMEDFIRFLHAFYRQPYAMQILSFVVEQPPLARAKPLHISSLQIEAITLSSEGLPGALTATRPDDPKNREEVKPWRPADPAIDAYAVVWNKKFMEPFTEQVAKPSPPPPAEPTVASVILSPGGGVVTNPIEVRMSCSTAGATIRYTTDDSTPTPTTGNVYDNNPVRVTGPITIKAIAFKKGMKDSPVAVAAFTTPPAPPLRLIALWTYTPVAEAVFLNEQSKDRIYVREGDSFDGGRLLLVLPEAAVVGMPDGTRYVYMLGKPVKERERLDPAKQPEIAAAVEILVDSH